MRFTRRPIAVLTDDMVATAMDADLPKFLDHENLMYLTVGCYDCEKALPEVGHDSRCEVPA